MFNGIIIVLHIWFTVGGMTLGYIKATFAFALWCQAGMTMNGVRLKILGVLPRTALISFTFGLSAPSFQFSLLGCTVPWSSNANICAWIAIKNCGNLWSNPVRVSMKLKPFSWGWVATLPSEQTRQDEKFSLGSTGPLQGP